MKVVLISPYGSLVNTGLRVLSACLLKSGHEPYMVFLPTADEATSLLLFEPSQLYSRGVIDQVVDLCADAGLVGITVMTNHVYKARQLTQALVERLSVPVIWGGIHPTAQPRECLEYANMVCIGEGEEPLVELADRLSANRPYADVANLCYKSQDGDIVCNPPRPLIKDLDALPFPDFGPENHYVLHEELVRPLTPALLHFYLMSASVTGSPVYPLLASRGCPHRCSYCCNDLYARLYDDWRHIRRRSNESLIQEIQLFRHKFPFIGEVAFYDDVFVAAPTRVIADFARLYKEKVDLPFYCIFSPLTVNEPKLQALLDAGLVKVGMGIETGSLQTQQLYSRPISNETVIKATRLINKYADRMLPPDYDIITDNPYEDTADQLETLALLWQIPTPFRLGMYSLSFYPGTALYERALEDNLLPADREETYRRNFTRLDPTFYNLVLFGYHRQFPRFLLGLASHKLVFGLLSSVALAPLWRLVNILLIRLRAWYGQRKRSRYRKHLTRLVETP